MRTAAILSAFVLLTASLPISAQSVAGNIIRCESNDGRTRECAVGWARDARLIRQLSRSACVEGESWGVTRRSVWVAHGCRGEFLIDDRGRDFDRGGGFDGGREDYLRCESDDGRWNRCALPGRGRVELVRQLSRSACVRGRSWGVDDGAVWVSGGCRAEFRVQRRGFEAPSPRRFTCESASGAPRTCAVDPRADVRLVRQLSRAPCVERQSWGRERGGVWVAQGCRAEFEVAGRGWRDD